LVRNEDKIKNNRRKKKGAPRVKPQNTITKKRELVLKPHRREGKGG